MEYSVRIDSTHRIVVAAATGAMTRGGVMAMVEAARAEAKAGGGLPILYDIRGAVPGQVAKADIFWMARSSPALKDRKEARIRIATLFPPDHAALARFWEDAYRNAGVQARAFGDEREAIAWLTEA